MLPVLETATIAPLMYNSDFVTLMLSLEETDTLTLFALVMMAPFLGFVTVVTGAIVSGAGVGDGEGLGVGAAPATTLAALTRPEP
jgi:hypothetical protein